MSQISPPIRVLLVCSLAFMAAWMLFLRPKTDAGAPVAASPPAAGSRPVDPGGAKANSAAGKAVEQANKAVAAQDARAERLADGVEGAGAPASRPATAAPAPRPSGGAALAPKPGKLSRTPAAAGLPLRVLKAIAERKVIVLLFWSPRSADDRAVRAALRDIDRHGGKVLAHATHAKKIFAYQQITRTASVEQSPTIVIVDRDRRARTLVGYADRDTIDRAVADALR